MLSGSGFCVAREPRLPRSLYFQTRRKIRVSLTKLFCIRKAVKAKANDAAKYPTIYKEAVRKGSGSHELALGFVPLDNPASGRHPDCPLGPSLVFSRIAPTSQASTYRHRGEDFAGKISADLLFLDIRDAGDVLVRASDQ